MNRVLEGGQQEIFYLGLCLAHIELHHTKSSTVKFGTFTILHRFFFLFFIINKYNPNRTL